MLSTKIRSGNAEVIESNSVISFVPGPFGENPLVKSNKINPPNPIEIDFYHGNEFMFQLYFEFVDSNENSGHPSWESVPIKNTKTQKFIIKNLKKAKHSISNSLAFDIASAADGSMFYISFTATELEFSVKLDYTVYKVKGDSYEN